ncbi:MAG: hypothetical protein MZV65_29830 [Chromatiales bacterium]|nr:hypothetical protein [Chromatiales bacterium]
MTTRQPPDDRLPGEPDIARRYRDSGQELPSPALDARILAAAREASASPRARRGFGWRWAVPLSTAAVIVMSLGVVLLMTEEGALNRREPALPMVAEAPSAPPVSAESPAVRPGQDAAPAKADAPPVPSEKFAADAVEAKRAVTASVPSPAARRLKEAESPAARVAREETTAAGMLAQGAAVMSDKADVLAVQASGAPGAYQFNVTIRSPDTGCARYADWWEVLSEDGRLLYRRVLLHSHVGEQPFTRSGGPVPVQPGTVVWVRAHMNPAGYGGRALRGSVMAGFTAAELPADFAAGVAGQAPLPEARDF